MTKRPTRTIALELNEFASVPPSLVDPKTKGATKAITVDVKALFHHYFEAKYGNGEEDRGVYEYESRLTAGSDWRFKGSGIGVDRESKRNVSNELGKGFARWFHYEHLGFTYFCPFEDVLGRVNSDGSKWEKNGDGDLPDYVCGRDQRDVNLLEAKGRYSSISFKTKEFDSFKQQLQRARLVDAQGHALQVKGFVKCGSSDFVRSVPGLPGMQWAVGRRSIGFSDSTQRASTLDASRTADRSTGRPSRRFFASSEPGRSANRRGEMCEQPWFWRRLDRFGARRVLRLRRSYRRLPVRGRPERSRSALTWCTERAVRSSIPGERP